MTNNGEVKGAKKRLIQLEIITVHFSLWVLLEAHSKSALRQVERAGILQG